MNTEQIERRSAGIEFRVEGRKLIGLAAPFNTPTTIGGFTETIAPTAFRSSLADKRDVLALCDHNPSAVLARTKSGTLRLTESARGLEYEIDVPDTSTGRDVLALAQRGDLGGMSFGFRVPAGGDEWKGNHRTLKNVELVEVSVVQSHPAYKSTSVSARSVAAANPSIDERRVAILERGARS